MGKIYLAGPIELVDTEYSTVWRRRAAVEANEYYDLKVVDPTFYDGAIEKLSAAEVVIRDTYLLEQSDAILVDARRPGWGTAMEVLRAYQSGKIVVAWGVEKPSLFLEHHVAKFVNSPEEGVRYINDLLQLM